LSRNGDDPIQAPLLGRYLLRWSYFSSSRLSSSANVAGADTSRFLQSKPSQPTKRARAEKGQSRRRAPAVDHQETLAVNDKGETVLRLEGTLEAEAARGQQQRALARFARAQPAADAETSTQVSAPAAVAAVERQRHALEKFARQESPQDVEVQPDAESTSGSADLAALHGEFHRLRAQLLEREAQEGENERPPGYQ
jgi:hypothetical protein